MRNHSYENDFDLHENETACRTHFQMKSFVLRLVLKQRHKRTRNWPVGVWGDAFYVQSRMLMRKKENNEDIKDSSLTRRKFLVYSHLFF